MRVNIFTAFNTTLNPYILLFKETLERQGLSVRFTRNFNLLWLIANCKSCDCVHLHWLNFVYVPQRNSKSRIYKKLILIRFIRAVLDFLCLVDFSLTFLYAKSIDKIIVFTVHDLHDFDEKSLRRKLHLEIARNIVFRFANSIHVHNHHTRKLVEKRYNRKTGIFVIPHGNYIGYYDNQISRAEARQQLGLPKDAFVYLFLGLLRPYKGLKELFDAFKKLENPKARLVVVGRVFGANNYASNLKDSCKTDSRIKFVPKFIPDKAVQIYLNACDFFVLPYQNITTSGAAVLALSFGRPIIAPSIATFPEIITANTGILYNASEPNALTLALQTAMKRKFSESKIFSYAHQFDWFKLGGHIVDLYKKA